MAKYLIKNIELVKKVYIVEAYNVPSAELTVKSQAPYSVDVLKEVGYEITPINEYEYNKYYTENTHQHDWVEGASGRSVYRDPDLGPDQLKDEDHSNASWHSRTGGGGFGPNFGPTGTDIGKD